MSLLCFMESVQKVYHRTQRIAECFIGRGAAGAGELKECQEGCWYDPAADGGEGGEIGVKKKH